MMPIVSILMMLSVLVANATSQTVQEAKEFLVQVESLEHFEQIKQDNPDLDLPIWRTLASDSAFYPLLTKAAIGDIVVEQFSEQAPKYVHKVFAFEETEVCRVQYIFLDGSSLSLKKIKALRSEIIKKYKSGIPFDSLVKQYNMDHSSGDTGWFDEKKMVVEFYNATVNRKKGDVYTVDVADNKWYYVVLKTYDNQMGKVVVSLTIPCEE